MKKPLILLSLAAFLLLYACSLSGTKDDNYKKSPINPNGDSELALLMRDMFAEGMSIKTQVQHGMAPAMKVGIEKIHTASATEPDKVASQAYHDFAISYQKAADSLRKASPETAPAAYTYMVDACMNCHQAMCPGPMVRIKKMYLDDK